LTISAGPDRMGTGPVMALADGIRPEHEKEDST
jgi:hypothetical protein